MNLVTWGVFFILLQQSYSAKILVVLPLPLWSHYMQFEHLYHTLASRGHQVTVYSSFPPASPIPNFHHVNITMEKAKGFFDNLNHFEYKDAQVDESIGFLDRVATQNIIWTFGLSLVKELFDDSAFQELYNSNDKYDLIITENYFGQEALVILGTKFKAPIIAEQSFGTPHNTYLVMGNPNFYSYMPDYKFTFSTRMNFFQRLQNTALGVYTHIVGDLWYFPKQDELMRQFSTEDNLPYIKTLLKNISATLIYSHPLLEFPRPQVSNLIYVAGIHLVNKKLPKDIEIIMTNSPKGVIYISFGSIITPSKMTEELKSQMIRVFSKIDLTVLWRWNGKPMQNLPKNIIQKSWLPQQDILAHPNCRLFITHGGVNSIVEAIHYAVPMVGISFYGDQPRNVKRIVESGMGVELSYHNISEQSLLWATNTVLGNRGYKYSAIKARQRFNDRQISPLESAVWWVEYVLRHHGAPHLRSAYDDLSWTEFLLLDVLSFVLGVVLVVLYLLLRTGVFIKNLVVAPLRRKVKGE